MIVQVLATFLEDLMLPPAVFLFAMRFPRRKQFIPRLIAVCSVFSLLQLAMTSFIWAYLRSSSWLLYALQLHSVLLIVETVWIVLIVWRIDLRTALQAVVMGYALQNIASNVNSSIPSPFGDVLVKSQLSANIIKHLAVFAAVYALGWLVFARRLRHNQAAPRLKVSLLGVVLIVLCCIILPSQFYTFEFAFDQSNFINLVLHIFNIAFCLVILEMELQLLYALEERDVNDRLHWLLEQKHEQFEAAKANAELIRVKYHDLKHYLNSEQEKDSIGAMLTEDMKEGIQRYDAQYDTGCSALDVVLTEKAMRCIREKVVFSCMADGTALKEMRSVDVYALFSNALDNAIEAVAPCEPEKRVISMSLTMKGRLACLHIENYCSAPLTMRGGELQSTKTDGDWHGYGTRSIRMIVEKYGGTLQMKTEDSIFSLDALLPLAKAA